MNGRKAIVDTIGTQTRLVVLEDGEPVEFAVSYAGGRQDRLGNLYKARVQTLLRGMHAAFVNIGDEKNAFLSLDDLPPELAGVSAGPARLARRAPLRAGDELIVQIVKEPGGEKGPKVSMNPSLAGRFAVLLPTVSSFGVSRRIDGDGQRERLLPLIRSLAPEGMGIVARTAAREADDAQIAADVQALCERWQQAQALANVKNAPALLYDEGDLAARAARDLNCTVERAPFDDHVESRLQKALRRKVWLQSGAFLAIDRCEAMTMIDVNSGKFIGKKNLAETLLKLNCEAAREIARLIRLRDLGGIIVIDFVDMDTQEDRQTVLETFEQAMRADRAKRRIHGFTSTGLMEMTRRPLWGAAEDQLTQDCPCCGARGYAQSPLAAAHELLRSVRRRRTGGDESVITLHPPQAVAKALYQIGLPPDVVIGEAGKGDQ